MTEIITVNTNGGGAKLKTEPSSTDAFAEQGVQMVEPNEVKLPEIDSRIPQRVESSTSLKMTSVMTNSEKNSYGVSEMHAFPNDWVLFCGRSEQVTYDTKEFASPTFTFGKEIITLQYRHELPPPSSDYFEVEIIDVWGSPNYHGHLFGFMRNGKQFLPGEKTKMTIAETDDAWCVGFHEKNRKGRTIGVYHNYSDKAQERPRPIWGASSSSPRDGIKRQWIPGDVICVYYDKAKGEIWFGLNGDWRFHKGLAFTDVNEDLYPVFSFSQGIVRVYTNRAKTRFEPPTESDRINVEPLFFTLPSKPLDEKGELDMASSYVEEMKALDKIEQKEETDIKNFWGLEFNNEKLQNKEIAFGSFRITKCDSRKEAYQAGIRAGMVIRSVNGLKISEKNHERLINILTKTQSETKLELENQFPEGTYRLFKARAYESGKNLQITSHFDPDSAISGYLKDGEEVDILLTKIYIDKMNKKRLTPYLRGLVGKRHKDKNTGVCITKQITIYTDPKDELNAPTGHFLKYMDEFQMQKETYKDEDNVWYQIAGTGGWITIETTELGLPNVVTGAKVTGWITVHDYDFNLPSVRTTPKVALQQMKSLEN